MNQLPIPIDLNNTLSSRTATVLGGSHEPSLMATSFAGERSSSSSGSSSRSSTTFLVIILWHVVFFYHWNGRRKQKHVLLDYETTVQKKRFHRLWITLFSHPSSSSTPSGRNDTATPEESQQSRAIEMGDYSAASAANQELLMSSTFLPRTWDRAVNDYSKRVLLALRLQFLAIENSGALLLLYNSHILWSCRALEKDFSHTPWNYARILLCWGVIAFAAELCLSHSLVKRLSTIVGSSVSTQPRRSDNEESSDVIERIYRRLLYRSMGSPTVISATILSIFQFQYPFVSLQVLPFLGNPWFLKAAPPLCYMLCVSILALLSRHCHFLCGALFGGVVGLLWSAGWIDFLAEPYWNVSFFCMFLALTFISLRATSRRWSSFLPCIEHVSWNSRGQILAQDDSGRWVPQQDGNLFHEEEDYEDGYYSTSDGSSSAEDIAARAFPPSDDEEIYGGSFQEGIDLESNRTNRFGFDDERVPLRQVSSLSSDFINNVRSRRGGNARQLR